MDLLFNSFGTPPTSTTCKYCLVACQRTARLIDTLIIIHGSLLELKNNPILNITKGFKFGSIAN